MQNRNTYLTPQLAAADLSFVVDGHAHNAGTEDTHFLGPISPLAMFRLGERNSVVQTAQIVVRLHIQLLH